MKLFKKKNDKCPACLGGGWVVIRPLAFSGASGWPCGLCKGSGSKVMYDKTMAKIEAARELAKSKRSE